MAAKEEVKRLISMKDDLEKEIRHLYAYLEQNNTTMDEPLVDSEGYPRADIDVPGVRATRQKIICNPNDLKDLMHQIEHGIYAAHAEAKAANEDGSPLAKVSKDETPIAHRVSNVPFLRIDDVVPGSPAADAGLKQNDVIIQFGTLCTANYSQYSQVADIVKNSVNTTIRVTLLRDEHPVRVALVPKAWSGQGLLGDVQRVSADMTQQRVNLNVGGQRYSTTVSTLQQDADSMLGRMFSASWRAGIDSSALPEVFIDSDGTHFRFILNYLRRGANVHLPSDADVLHELLVEAQYYQLKGLIELIQCRLRLLGPGIALSTSSGWQPNVGDRVQWRPETVDGFWQSVAIAVASFHYQTAQSEAVCGFMQKTKYLPDDMEVIFLRCVSCRASTRVGEVWRYDLESLAPIRATMVGTVMQISGAPAASMSGRVSSDCVSVLWSSNMTLHVSKSALMPAV